MSDELALLRDILDQYGWSDVSIPFPAFGDRPVWSASARVILRADAFSQDSAAAWRADALAVAEKLIAELSDNLWIMTSAPRIEFSGSLRQATVTLDGKVVIEPGEGGLKCEVALQLDRVTRRLAKEEKP